METAIQRNENFWYATPDISVLWDNSVAPLTRFIFTIICSFATLKKRNAWPSNRTVAKIVGVSVATVKRAYQELTKKGIIMRVPRYKKDKGQTSSLTYIIGREAPCYSMKAPLAIPEAPTEETLFEPVEPSAIPQLTSELPPGSPMSHEGNDIKELKASLTREAELPNLTFTDVTPGNSPIPETPKEAPVHSDKSLESSTPRTESPEVPEKTPIKAEHYSPEDAPDIMRPTARYFLHMTGRTFLRWNEISALRELSAHQYPTRVQKEIDRACERFRRNGKSLDTLNLCYIAGALRDQPSLKRKSRKKSEPDSMSLTNEEIAQTQQTYTEEDMKRVEAMMRERG